jgi:conjugative transfer region protein (TIGR03750 family)
MEERAHSVNFLPDRLNREPVVFRGLTNSEMFVLLKVGALIWFPLSIAVCWWMGAAILGLGVGMLLTMGTVMLGGLLLQRKKRGKPEGWYERYLKIYLQDYGISSYGFIRYSGPWDIRRRERL